MKVKFLKINEDAVLPKKATKGAAAYDLYTPQHTIVQRGRQVIPLDFAIEIPYGYEAKVEPRSGFSSKGMEGVLVISSHDTQANARFNCDVIQGKIDSDYRGNVGVIISNQDCEFLLPKHTRIAQLTFYKVEDAEFEVVDELSETERGEGGFGSTDGKQEG